MKILSSLKWKSTGKTLGQGGQASVVEVTNETGEFSGTFALKGLAKGKPKQAYERFAREIEAIKQIRHSSIIQIIDHSNPTDEFQFYVMEFVEGAKSLKHILSGSKNPYYANPQKSLQLFIQLVEAIYNWSESNIVHRDLSLGNVLVLSDDSIKVIDFGICQIDGGDTITLIDEGVGTPNYMAPECESGALGEVSIASDLYSAGKILWSIVTSMNAFPVNLQYSDKNQSQIFYLILQRLGIFNIFLRKLSVRTLKIDVKMQRKRSILHDVFNS